VKKIISIQSIADAVEHLIYQASFNLPEDVKNIFKLMAVSEKSPMARETLQVLFENSEIAEKENFPLCQDCGAVGIFLEIGIDVTLTGTDFDAGINNAVAAAYKKYNLRASIVADPLRRKNTGTNTPAFIHTDIVPGDRVKLTVYLKGGGSENMTSLRMFRPTDSIDIIIYHIEERVIEAGPNPCPPIFLGIGIGGTADMALLNSKKAVLRGVGTKHPDTFYQDLENRIFERLNATNIGPLGFGGRSTVAEVYIKEAPSHIASLPVALNMNCHSLRYRSITI
jgi:fumarate hydratase subunit alpha